MLLKRFYDEKLAQASYLIGCQATHEAIVIDPNRDVEQYVRAAKENGMRIAQVSETHIHADFVSGSKELAERTGATLCLSEEGGDHWRYTFAAGSHARLLHDGDIITIGNIKLDVMHTPGHTPEHIVFMITDTPATNRPMGVITGDFIFVGDVGRPDLLERAANIAGTMEHGARVLFKSLQRFKQLPDYLQLWPGHGAGSACGKALGAVPSTTLGYERIANWGLVTDSEEEFVSMVLAGQPEPPKYFAHMKRINREGPRSLNGFSVPAHQSPDSLTKVIESGALVVDTRKAVTFAAGYVPGTLNVPLNKSFTNYAGSVVPFDREFYLIVDGSEKAAAEAAHDLAMIGYDKVAGWFGTDAIVSWAQAGGSLGNTPQLTAQELAQGRNGAYVLDVRGAAEYAEGHLTNVSNIPLQQLTGRLDEIPRDAEIILHCQGGGRAAIAASVLKANGFANVSNFSGGYAEWVRSGLPTERG